MSQYNSYAGYIAALFIIFFSYLLIFLKLNNYIAQVTSDYLLIMVTSIFIIMIIWEVLQRRKHNEKYKIETEFNSLSSSSSYILKSAFYRYISLFVSLAFFTCIVNCLPYFSIGKLFAPTVDFFNYVLIVFLVFAFPYIYITLKYRGDKKYEYNDYAILTMIGMRSIVSVLWTRGKQSKQFFKNRRVKKVFLVYLVNFFFITLMVRFLSQEFSGFEKHIYRLFSENYMQLHWYEQARNTYFILFHTIFLVDVSIGIIGYVSASRWLNNRTKSVDMTIVGWFVALFCYPPFNNFFYTYLLPYNSFETTAVVTSQVVWTFIFVILLVLYAIYVWATIALGFKFSNLTNRGIVTHGPYKYARHPAYAAKNFAWLIDYNYLLSNIFAFVTFLGWNAVYVLRGVTEEQHLSKDKAYRDYKKKVRYMFIPKVV